MPGALNVTYWNHGLCEEMGSDWLLKPMQSFVYDGEILTSLGYWTDES